MRKATSDPQILVYFTNWPDQIVGGDPLCPHIQDQGQHERMIVEMVRPFEVGMVHLPNDDVMVVMGLWSKGKDRQKAI